MPGVSVAFVDDRPMLLHGLLNSFGERSDFNIVGAGVNCADARRIAAIVSPHVLIMNVRLPGDSYATISEISRCSERTSVFVFTGSKSPDIAIRCIESGARGFLLTGSSADDLARAIAKVAAGELFIDPQFAAAVLVAMRRQHIPTPADQMRLNYRETQIVKMLLTGKRNKEIATQLGLTEKTVKSYMSVLMQKMGVRSRMEVALAAQQARQWRG